MILITGANGQLGYDFQKLFDSIKEEYIATDVNDLDITDIEKVREFVKDKNISLIINCAAYNNVDKAEDEVELCKKLNTYAPRDLAKVANEIGAEYITYSTDFVFDGKKKTPYTEEDIPNPLSIYGKSKYEGEKEVFKVKPNSFVVRTSWVFGIANNNFNKQVINWSKSKEELSIVDDQISSPTYSKDLAYYSWELIKTKKYGLYHLSNGGEASKYDQAKYVLEKINWQGKLNRAKTKDFSLKAERAEYTKLDSSKLEKVIGKKIPTWESGIDGFIKNLGRYEMIKQNKELMIFIATHKIVEFYQNKSFFPILVGAGNSDLNIELKDNLGDNISFKNKNFCELTALYWIWKNIDNKYVGVCHYRRYFNKKNIKICEYKNINKEYMEFNNSEVIETLKKYDLILPNIYSLNKTVKEHYEEYHIKENLEEVGKIIKEKYEKTYFKNWEITLNNTYLYPYNMMICKKELFDNYCDWLFDILFELEKRIVISNDPYQARVFGFISERLMYLYVITNKLKVKEMNVTQLGSIVEVIKEKIKSIIRPLFFWRN